MEIKAPEIPSSELYWEQPNCLRYLLYFILLFSSKVSKPSKKLLLRIARQGNSRTKGNHSPSSLNWARHVKEDESATALRGQGMWDKSIKSGENPEFGFPTQPWCTTYTHNWHLRLQVPLGHKSFIFGKQPSVQTYGCQPAIAQAGRERTSASICVRIEDAKKWSKQEGKLNKPSANQGFPRHSTTQWITSGMKNYEHHKNIIDDVLMEALLRNH